MILQYARYQLIIKLNYRNSDINNIGLQKSHAAILHPTEQHALNTATKLLIYAIGYVHTDNEVSTDNTNIPKESTDHRLRITNHRLLPTYDEKQS